MIDPKELLELLAQQMVSYATENTTYLSKEVLHQRAQACVDIARKHGIESDALWNRANEIHGEEFRK